MKIVQTFTTPVSLCFLDGQVTFWQENGHDLHILTSDKDKLLAFSQKHQVPTKAVAFRRSLWLWGHDVISFFQLIWYFFKEKPQVIHGNTPKAAFISMIIARFCRVKVRVYEMHGLPLETARGWKKPFLKIAEKIACGCATQILAVSESLRDSVLKYELTKPSKITVLHHGSCNGVDAEQKFNPANVCPVELDKIRQKWQLQHFQSIVGFVGRLTLEKGIQELYDAWQIIKTTHPHACLMLVGGEDDREKLPESLKAQLEKDPSIVSIGAVESVAPYYALMDFMVLPSHREGFGNVVIEAAAMTKPTVATYVTGLKDAVKANETGLFCTPHCPEDLADKIQTYLQNPTLAYTHGQAARKRVRVAFVPQNMWRAKLQLYRRLWAATQSVPLWHVSPSIQTAD